MTEQPAFRKFLAPATVVLGFGLAAAAVTLPVSVPASSTGQTRVVSQALACPVARSGQGVVTPLGSPTVLSLSGKDVVARPSAADMVLPAEQNQTSGGLLFGAGAVTAWGSCQPGAADQWLLLPSVENADLLLSNPDTNDAVADLTILVDGAPVPAIGTTNITVPGGRQRVVPLSVQVPVGKPVAVRVMSTRGRVSAHARLQGKDFADLVHGVSPDRSLQIPAIPAGGRTQLLLANPTDTRAVVKPTAHGARGGFVPAGNDSIEVAAHSVRLVDLGSVFATEAGALSLDSDQPVVASLVSHRPDKDVALVAAQRPSTQLQLASPAGVLVVTNPSQRPVKIVLGLGQREGIELQLAPGASLQQKVEQTSIRLEADSEVTAAVLVRTGGAVAAMQATGDRIEVPRMEPAPTMR